MCTKQELSEIMHQLVQATCSLFGETVKEIILFGSYARNEADDESDIDVMVLLDIPREQIPTLRRKVAQIAGELLFEHGIVVSPILESKAFFDRNRSMYPFFKNVDQEGIRYVA